MPSRGTKVPIAASVARISACEAGWFVTKENIQTHGGIGITMELAIGHYFKRGTMIEGQFGSIDHHLDRFEALSYPA